MLVRRRVPLPNVGVRSRSVTCRIDGAILAMKFHATTENINTMRMHTHRETNVLRQVESLPTPHAMPTPHFAHSNINSPFANQLSVLFRLPRVAHSFNSLMWTHSKQKKRMRKGNKKAGKIIAHNCRLAWPWPWPWPTPSLLRAFY